ncbi:piggyBac transposable element-derived protein 4-like [Bactrocera tryoni]|uniref:piggyBac transposable element-derived protein 4-like n=1 Tax=Bactrocera tryoni TaxID=59916 RepID=UPI001A976731|nr:piggyBac transposable element-derived protein 4-like [Bactrocera tryoni]
MKTVHFRVVGTYIYAKSKGNSGVQSHFQICCDGIMATRWMDSNEVLVAANCHKPIISIVDKKQKDGKKKQDDCPSAIVDYNRIMRGVDLSDQKSAVYDLYRKSQRWWKKVFFKALMLSAVNAWIVHSDLNRKKNIVDIVHGIVSRVIDSGRNKAQKNKSSSDWRKTSD